ncbi:hypothetical protein A1WG_03365 [Escherichia sp. KTE96]|nr:hypothetical protein A1WG_03365 [Escherichia sp. KTE96]
MYLRLLQRVLRVHCRTGSLENSAQRAGVHTDVHCRTGSLETQIVDNFVAVSVHCRTGSLETSQHDSAR